MTETADLSFAGLAGWADDDHAAAFAVFRRSGQRMRDVAPRTGSLGVDGALLARAGAEAARLPELERAAARTFFETWFTPRSIAPPAEGFLTGYFEPELAGARTRSARFTVPLLARPDDLVDVTPANAPAGWDKTFTFARQTATGLVPYHTRADIEDGALAGRGLELVWLESPVDAFFAQVQGSVRIRIDGGTGVLRLSYAAKTGHPYTSIGRVLVERGVATPETMTLDLLAAWLAANPAEGRALMRQNRSYIFFRELPDDLDPTLGATAAAGVQITPGRSLAVDRSLHTYGTPVWLAANLPGIPDGRAAPFRRLMIAQDTGSAIVGPARGDIFVGIGAEAGHAAGLFRHRPEAFVILAPREHPRSGGG